MRSVTVTALAAGLVLLAVAAAHAQVDKRNFNFNVPGCPTNASGLQTVNYDKFTDGSPLPSCSATAGTARYKFVWIGYHWAVYGPATTTVYPAPQPHVTPAPAFPALTSLPTAKSMQTGHEGATLYGYNNKWYVLSGSVPLNSPQAQKLIADNGGGIVSHDSGTLLSTNGGNLLKLSLIGSDSAGVVGPGAGTPPPGIISSNSGGIISLSGLPSGHRPGDALTCYQYNGSWYSAHVIAANSANTIAAGGGNVVARDDHGAYYQLTRVIATGGGNIIANPGVQQNIISNPNSITINQGSNLRH